MRVDWCVSSHSPRVSPGAGYVLGGGQKNGVCVPQRQPRPLAGPENRPASAPQQPRWARTSAAREVDASMSPIRRSALAFRW